MFWCLHPQCGLNKNFRVVVLTLVMMCAVLVVITEESVALVHTDSQICSSELDCRLNGACVDGRCVCDQGWKGQFCQSLVVSPATLAYGFNNTLTPNTSCWGGGPPYRDQNGTYHLFVTELANHCGMGTWGRMSQVAHTVSKNFEGPYQKIETPIPTESHNVYYAFSEVDKTHLIFHIGESNNPPSCNPWLNCSDGTTPGGNGPGKPSVPWPPATCPQNMVMVIHYSSSLYGPWTKFMPKLPTIAGWNGSHDGTNPGPLILPNGTILLMTRTGNQRTLPNGTRQHYQNILLFRAQSWKSDFEWVKGRGDNGALDINYAGSNFQTEDPTLWKGRRGYHALFHQLSHAWSSDGIEWHWEGNVTCSVTLSWNGENRYDHERPRVTINEHGDLESLWVSSMVGSKEYSGTIGKDAAQLLYMKVGGD